MAFTKMLHFYQMFILDCSRLPVGVDVGVGLILCEAQRFEFIISSFNEFRG